MSGGGEDVSGSDGGQLICWCTEMRYLTLDCLSQVLDSIKGNGLGSFALIRGIADYIDGSTGGIWQPYASLAASAFMKAVILRLIIN